MEASVQANPECYSNASTPAIGLPPPAPSAALAAQVEDQSGPDSEVPPKPIPVTLPAASVEKPKRAIFCEKDLKSFKESTTCQDIFNFVKALADAAADKKLSDASNYPACPVIDAFVAFAHRLHDLIDEIPPLKQPMRFGNKAFRAWHARLVEWIPSFLSSMLATATSEATIRDLTPYLETAFGNETRIDYGTGHELGFVLFFLCLHKLQLIRDSDLPNVVLNAFAAYMRTVRRLQDAYMLEPAGTHGVWGLDDYHCLLFVWGAAQLVRNQDEITPSSIHDLEMLKEYASEYYYLDGIRWIRKVKAAAPFAETSPMLNDISGMADWSRVLLGLLRLFQGEVLFKLPVVQHLVFGELIPCTWKVEGSDARLSAGAVAATGHLGGTASLPAFHAIGFHPASGAFGAGSAAVKISSATRTALMTTLRPSAAVAGGHSISGTGIQQPITASIAVSAAGINNSLSPNSNEAPK